MTEPELRPVYAVAGRTLAIRRSELTSPSEAFPVFDGDARVGNRDCRVRSLATPGRDVLQISGAGLFAIPHEEARIDVDPEPGAEEAAIAEALLGPALALALARRGIFVLHASAVVWRGHGALGFLGDSGAGKSTLARLLAEAGAGDIALAADDLLAIEDGVPGPVALPHFPQLKLGAEAMAALTRLEPRHPLLGLYALDPAPPAAQAHAGEPLPPASAAALLVRHTVASVLFPEDLLAAHFAFVTGLAGRVPIRRLIVPRRLDVGAEVLRTLTPRAR